MSIENPKPQIHDKERVTIKSRWKKGVYCIRNILDGRVYIGSSSRCIYVRCNLHKSQLRRGAHHSIFLQRSWDKHGEDSFEFIILVECSAEDCLVKEQEFLQIYDSCSSNNGFNMSPNVCSSLGIKRRPESRLKMSLAKIGHVQSAEQRRKNSEANKGKVIPEEQRKKIAETLRGRVRPREVFKKMWETRRKKMEASNPSLCETSTLSTRPDEIS